MRISRGLPGGLTKSGHDYDQLAGEDSGVDQHGDQLK
jgi:hypothetical protein